MVDWFETLKLLLLNNRKRKTILAHYKTRHIMHKTQNILHNTNLKRNNILKLKTAKNGIHFIIVFFLSSLGPSFLLFRPWGTHDLSLFLHFSSSLHKVCSVQSTALSNRVNWMCSFMNTVSINLPSPTIMSLCWVMQWVAKLQVSLAHLTWLLWFDHLALGLSVWPT